MPGATAFTEVGQAVYSAMALAELGDRSAEVFAREVIAGAPAAEDRGLAWVAVGSSRAGRDPGAAAEAGLCALEATRSWPSTPVETDVRGLHRALIREHGRVAEVVRLGEACAALRPAVDA
jgi:hypothetical protein